MPLLPNESQIIQQHRPISCAECRRLKLRCNRTFPCTSCERRGCAEICPDSVLPTVARKSRNHIRISRAITAEQDETTNALRERIRVLEEKLSALQASHSPQMPDSLAGNLPDEAASAVDGLTENLGTLSMTGYGKSRFFGANGGALERLNFWTFRNRIEGQEKISTSETGLDDLPAEIIYLSSAFLPRRTPNSLPIANWMIANLPPFTEAWNLCESFFKYGAYIFVPLWRSMFMDEIFGFFYGDKEKNNVDIPQGHRLSLLYIVFALGELYDLNKPPRPTGGNRFYHLSRAALALEPFYDQPTLTALQAHLLLCIFLAMSDHKEAAELVYAMSAINVRLSFSLGLHREWQKFNENVQPDTEGEEQSHTPKPSEQEIRRIIFLAALHFEVWQCLQYGRPSQLNFDQFDFAPPGTFFQRDSFIETEHMKGQTWSYAFVRDCAIPVLNIVVAVKPPNYAEVIKLHEKIEKYPLSDVVRDSLLEQIPPNEKVTPAFVTLQFSIYSLKETLLLCLHRQYFAYAMTDYSRDPLGCPFARSVFAAFVSSCKVVLKIGLVLKKEPKLSVRIYLFWVQLLIPCLVFATIVMRSPGCNLASTALDQLDRVCEILQRASEGCKAALFLPHALKLQEKAHAAYDSYYSFPGAVPHAVIDITREISALGGKSRVSPSTTPAGSPAAPEQQDSETRLSTRSQSQDPVGLVPSSAVPPKSSVNPHMYRVEEIPSMTVQPRETSTTPITYTQSQAQEWNIDSPPVGPNLNANYDQLPQQGTNTDQSYVGYGSQDFTNQLLGLFTSENDPAGFVPNMTYPDPPPTSSTHSSWENFFSYMLQS